MVSPVMPRGLAKLKNDSNRPFPYRDPGARPRYLVLLIAGALLFAAILTVPRLFKQRTGASPVATSKTAGQSAVQKAVNSTKPAVSRNAKSTVAAPPQAVQRTAPPAVAQSLKATSEKAPSPPAASSLTPAASKESIKSEAVALSSSKGEVLDQVLPDVSKKARATIHGKVRVNIKLQVGPSGNVTGAEFDSPGPSKFFADLAMEASRKWAFTPPEVNGKSVASEWRLRYEFTSKDTKVAPTQIAPL
jgi:TonB family protein